MQCNAIQSVLAYSPETSFRKKIADLIVDERAQKQIDFETLSKLLRDPVIVTVVTVLDIASLSILELLESGLTRQDVNHALTNGVIEIDKETAPKAEVSSAEDLLVAGDIYFMKFLSSKVRLTGLGLYLLECIKECQTEQEIIEKARERFKSGTFIPPEHPHRPG
jgi:hypothetical protein